MTICIIGAMEEEIAVLKRQMQHIVERKIAEQNFLHGEMHGKEVVLLKCGIGKVNAAIGTTLVSQLFKPSYVISMGSAGGVAPFCEIGDIVVATEIRYNDVDVTVFEYEFGQVPQLPASFTPDQNLLAIVENCAKSLPGINIKKGLITSGDGFITTERQVRVLRNNFPDVIAVEMESCAIAHACYLFNIPCIVLRAISDIINFKGNKEAFKENLSLTATKLADLIKCVLGEG